MQAERLREAIATPGTAADARDATMRLDADAHFLLVAIRNGLHFARRVQAVVNDVRLGEVIAGFADQFPYAHDLRDVLTHLDEYVLEQGRLQPEGQGRRKGEVAAGASSWRVVTDGDVVLVFGPSRSDCWLSQLSPSTSSTLPPRRGGGGSKKPRMTGRLDDRDV